MRNLVREHKADLLLLFAAAMLPSVVFMVMGPVQLYVSNMTEFWFPLQEMLGGCLLAGLLAAAILFAVGMILRGRAREIYVCLLMGVSVALYIQGNFVLTDYGVLDGREIPWNDYTFTAIWNTALWLFCLIAPFLAKRFVKQWRSVFQYVAWGIVLVQAVSLGALCLTTDFTRYQRSDNYLSERNLYAVSENRNVVTFVLDTFDARYLEEIRDTEPEFLAPLEGFTCFTNATSEYPSTMASLPYMLTGQLYLNEQPYVDYINAAWQHDGYYKALKDADFDVNLYTMDRFVSDEAKAAYCGNNGDGRIVVSSKGALEAAFLRFTAFRYFPHLAKRYVWFYSGIFDALRAAEGQEAAVFTMDNVRFYEGLRQEGLTVTERGGQYQFIHLDGAHPSYTLAEDVTYAADATAISQSKASLNIVYEYMRQLWEQGLYDSTMMIIVADHGYRDGLRSFAPILLVKPFGATGELSYSDAPVSHANLQATVMEALGLNADGAYGASVFEVSAESAETRRLLRYTWNGEWDTEYLPDIQELMALPDGNTPENFYLTGYVYRVGTVAYEEPYVYELGTPILFTAEPDNGTQYFMVGIADIEGKDSDSVWSLGKSGRMVLNIGESAAALEANIAFAAVYNGAQRVSIRSGGLTLYEGVVTVEELSLNFEIPRDCVKDGLLVLDFEYPDALSPQSNGTGTDSRELAVRYQRMELNETDAWQVAPVALDTPILFAPGPDSGTQYFLGGLSMVEGDSVWSDGKASRMALPMEKPDTALEASIVFVAVYTGEQRLIIRCGDAVLYEGVVAENSPYVDFIVPADCVANGVLTLDFEYPDACSPESRGESADARELAVRFQEIMLTEAE